MNREPGPKGVFLLGSFADFRRDPLGFCTRLASDYGDIAFFRTGPLKCVQVNRPEWVQHLLTQQAPRTHKSIDFKELEAVLGKGLVTLAAAYAQLAAHALGLASVWVGAFDDDAVLDAVSSPAGLVPSSLLPIGYPHGQPSPTARRPLSELVHQETMR